MDRTKSPQINKLKNFRLNRVENFSDVDNQIFILNNGTQEILRLEMVFDAGSKYDSKPGVSFITSKMLLEGSKKFSAFEIQEKIAQLGAFVEIHHNVERINLTFYVLNKFLDQLLHILDEIIRFPEFSQTNFQNLINISKNSLKINLQKNSIVAGQEIKKCLFGESHYYGISITEQDFDCITLNDVKDHYSKYINHAKFEFFAAGFVDDNVKNNLLAFTKKLNFKESILPIYDKPEIKTPQKILIEKGDALQSSIRIGKVLFNRKHPEYFKMMICNEILGGYFGSRLMKNIREEKGLTYGISSQLVSLYESGYFVIGTDVKRENTQIAIDEIYKEIDILRNILVSEEELQIVTNYMNGSYLGSINTPFAIMDKFKTIHYSGLNYGYFDEYIATLNNINAIEILDLAQRHLIDFHEVVVGGYS